jgi:Tfp pilus assembly protein PilE
MNKKNFTLLELLVVLSILTLLFVIAFWAIKPLEFFRKTRDAKRITDLENLKKAVELVLAENKGILILTTSTNNIIFLSLKDDSPTCSTYINSGLLPSPPAGYEYRCSNSPENINNGWLPINFSSSTLVNLSKLLIDPQNSPPYFYSFITNGTNFEFTAYLESENNKGPNSISSNDKGKSDYVYETGNSNITPISFLNSRSGVISASCFAKTFGTVDKQQGIHAIRDSNNNFVIAGYGRYSSASDFDFWVLKLDNSGNLIAQTNFGGGSDDYFYNIIQTNDGGYLLVGWSKSYGGTNDAIAAKLGNSLNLNWLKFYGTSTSDYFRAAVEVDDGYILGGYISEAGKAYIVKVNKNSGDPIWQKLYSTSTGPLEIYEMKMLSDGNIGIVGVYNNAMIWFSKIDKNGNVLLSKVYSSNGNNIGVTFDLDGNNLIIGARTTGVNSTQDILLLKLDSQGNIISNRVLTGSGTEDIRKIIALDDGYLIGGYTNSSPALSYDYLLAKVNKNFDNFSILFQKIYGGSGADYGRGLSLGGDGGILISGYTASVGVGSDDIWLVKTNSSGVINFNTTSVITTNANLSVSYLGLFLTLDLPLIVEDVTNSYFAVTLPSLNTNRISYAELSQSNSCE